MFLSGNDNSTADKQAMPSCYECRPFVAMRFDLRDYWEFDVLGRRKGLFLVRWSWNPTTSWTRCATVTIYFPPCTRNLRMDGLFAQRISVRVQFEESSVIFRNDRILPLYQLLANLILDWSAAANDWLPILIVTFIENIEIVCWVSKTMPWVLADDRQLLQLNRDSTIRDIIIKV
jgi:hypothetical protein